MLRASPAEELDQSQKPTEQSASIKQNPSTFFSPDYIHRQFQVALPGLLRRYQGKEVDVSQLPVYTEGRDMFEMTHMEGARRLDIRHALAVYEHQMPKFDGASFTLFLMWSWTKALQKVREFNFRYINGTWFEFKNLPLFTTLAADPANPTQLSNLLIEGFAKMSWGLACQHYSEAKYALQQSKEAKMYPCPVYAVATHISNIRLSFTHGSGPVSKKEIEIERHMFVFGERKVTADEATVPLTARLPHASLNPALMAELITEWKTELAMIPAQNTFRAKL